MQINYELILTHRLFVTAETLAMFVNDPDTHNTYVYPSLLYVYVISM